MKKSVFDLTTADWAAAANEAGRNAAQTATGRGRTVRGVVDVSIVPPCIIDVSGPDERLEVPPRRNRLRRATAA
jgi:hypothetical protein